MNIFLCLFWFLIQSLLYANYIPTSETNFPLSEPSSISGSFVFSKQGLHVVHSSQKSQSSHFIPSNGFYYDGIVRTTVEVGVKPLVDLLFRCQNPKEKCSSTYRISLNNSSVFFSIYERGVVIQKEKIGDLPKTLDGVEIVVVSHQKQHGVFVYDTKSANLLLSYSTSDNKWSSGYVGIEAQIDQDSNTYIKQLGLDSTKTNTNDHFYFDFIQVPLDSASDSRGVWRNDGGLFLEQGDPQSRYNIWVPQLSSYSNGMMKTDIHLGTKPDISLFFRYQNSSLENPCGYSISIENRNVVLYRWDDGIPRTIEKLGRLPKRFVNVQIVVLSLNHTHSVFVIHPSTNKTLYASQFSDSRWLLGVVAFRAHSQQDKNTKVTNLSFLASQQKLVGEESKLDLFGQEGRAIVKNLSKARLQKIPNLQWIESSKKGEHIIYSKRKVVKLILNKGGDFVELHWKIPYNFKNVEYIKAQAEIEEETYDPFKSQSYKNPFMLYEYLEKIHKKYPNITKLIQLTQSRNNLPVFALRITDNPNADENEPMILLNGAHHGSELISTEFALDAARYLLEGAETPIGKEYIQNFDFWIVPLVNPDGNLALWEEDHNIGRKNKWDVNGNGIIEYNEGTDLNRNYPFAWHTLEERGSSSFYNHNWFRGKTASSEPETKAMMKLANKYHPAVVFSWHTSGNMIISPYTIDGIPIPEPDIPWQIAEYLLKDLPKAPGKKKSMRLRRNMYSVDGTDQDWHYFTNGSIAYIIEGPKHNPAPPMMKKSIQYLRIILQRMLLYLNDGPRVFGTITNQDGEPLEATVKIQEHKTFLHENWKTRDYDGRFDRFTGSDGLYTVVVSAPGYKTKKRKVNVKGPTKVNISLIRSR